MKPPNVLGTFFEKSLFSPLFGALWLLFDLQMGQADVIFHGENAHNDYREEADYDGDLDVEIAPKADLIDDAADDAGHGVDFLAEDKRDFIDEHVTHHATGGSGNAAHDDGHPERLAHEERLLNAGNGEQGEAEGVEDKPGVVEAYETATEDDGGEEGEGCADEIDGIGHPERCEAEHHIAERAAANGSGQTYDIAPEPVELFGGGKAGA